MISTNIPQAVTPAGFKPGSSKENRMDPGLLPAGVTTKVEALIQHCWAGPLE
nr:hypothetical protein [Desulfobulbaceae bacterium]